MKHRFFLPLLIPCILCFAENTERAARLEPSPSTLSQPNYLSLGKEELASSLQSSPFADVPLKMTDSSETQKAEPWLDVRLYAGHVNGKSGEIVYVRAESGEVYRLSQLDWFIPNLWAMGAKISKSLLANTLHLSIKGWGKMAANNTTMIDRDWQDETSIKTLTDISVHKSRIEKAYELVAEMGYDFFSIKKNQSTLIVRWLIGYEHLFIAWDSFGSVYNYGTGTHKGWDPDMHRAIFYSQRFSIPYQGLQIGWNLNKMLKVVLFGKGSTTAAMQDRDIHFYRQIIFDSDFSRCSYWTVGGQVEWNLWKSLYYTMDYEYERFNKALGITTQKRPDTPDRTYGGAGAFHEHQTITLGLTTEF